jgi:UDP-glucose 4-epimerase
MLSKITGKSSISRVLPKRAGDLWYFVCDYEKAKKTLNWEPKIAPDLGLSFLCDWIEKNKELFK